MGCGTSKPSISHVVVVGGGYGGAYLTHLLQKEGFCKVTLIEPAEAMVHLMAIPRCIVEPEFLKKAFIAYQDFVQNWVRETATAIDANKRKVVLQNGKKMGYDYLVIALDSRGPFPQRLNEAAPGASTAEAKKLYKAFTEEMKKSPEIVLLGGNEFAVELAGEIRADYPDKKVSIIHEGAALLEESLPSEFLSLLMEMLDRKDVDVLLNNHVTNQEEVKLNKFAGGQLVATTSGRKIPCDLAITCENKSTAPTLIGASFAGSLEKSGELAVDNFMKVHNCANVYAIGDVTKNGKDPFEAKKQVKVVLENLKRDITMEGQRMIFQPSQKCMMVTIGRYGGIGYEDGKLLDEDDVMERKSEDLFTEKIWKDLDLNCSR